MSFGNRYLQVTLVIWMSIDDSTCKTVCFQSHLQVYNIHARTNGQICTDFRGVNDSPSLVPRPSHRPAFDPLQYPKMEGEGLVYLG